MDSERFLKELKDVINSNCMENGSDTPDFMLAEYLNDCLRAWNKGVKAREKWYGRGPQPPPTVYLDASSLVEKLGGPLKDSPSHLANVSPDDLLVDPIARSDG